MNFVSALSQFEPQFRRHHAAAAIGGVAGYPDSHSVSSRRLYLAFDGNPRDEIQDLIYRCRCGEAASRALFLLTMDGLYRGPALVIFDADDVAHRRRSA